MSDEEIKLDCLKLADRIKSPDYKYTLSVAKEYYNFICNPLEGTGLHIGADGKNQKAPAEQQV